MHLTHLSGRSHRGTSQGARSDACESGWSSAADRTALVPSWHRAHAAMVHQVTVRSSTCGDGAPGHRYRWCSPLLRQASRVSSQEVFRSFEAGEPCFATAGILPLGRPLVAIGPWTSPSYP